MDDFNNGDFVAAKKHFESAKAAGFKTPLFKNTPEQYIAKIDRFDQEQRDRVARAAAATQPVRPPTPPVAGALSPKDAYQLGVDEFNRGDFKAARKHLQLAREGGFRTPLFKQTPAQYLAKIDQAEATAIAATQPVAPVAPVTPAAPTAQDKAREAYQAGADEFSRGDFKAARKHFQLARDNGFRTPLFKQTPAQYLARIDQAEAEAIAATQPVAPVAPVTPAAPTAQDKAREAYQAGVEAFNRGDYAVARTQFQTARDNGFRTPLFKNTPAQYLAKIENIDEQKRLATQPVAPQAMEPAELYSAGVAAFDRGDYVTARKNFAAAQAANYRPAFKRTPAQYLAKIDEAEKATTPVTTRPAMPPTQPVGPMQPGQKDYEAGIADFNAGRYASARMKFMEAQAAGYKGPGFQESPELYITKIEAMAGGTTRPVGPVVGPSTQPSLTPEEQKLLATARMADILKAQHQFEAEQLVERAKKARADGRDQDAYAAYRDAKQLDPENAEAAKGEAELRHLLVGITPQDLLKKGVEDRQVVVDAIRWSFETAIQDARLATAKHEWAQAQASIDQARVARLSNPALFSRDELAAFDGQIQAAELRLKQEQAAIEEADRNAAKLKLIRDEQERAAQALAEKQRTLSKNIAEAKELIRNGDYEKAMGVLNHILSIEPNNDYATSVIDTVRDRAIILEQKKARQQYDLHMTRQLNYANASMTPYFDLLTYPKEWPDISEKRDAEVRAERSRGAGGGGAEGAVSSLDRPLPEVRLDGVALNDSIDFFRDITGANLFVNWNALAEAGVERTAPVSIGKHQNITFGKALQMVLSDVSGGRVKLAYSVDGNVISVSTAEDLNRNTNLQLYDIRDLLLVPPEVEAPKSWTENRDNHRGGRGTAAPAAPSCRRPTAPSTRAATPPSTRSR